MNNKQVDILLSVYNPNEEYLIKQLISLNNQTYPNLKLYIFDDCIKKRCNLDLFEKYITNFSYEVLPYCEENLNYMGAFEKLVQRSDGEYIAFCDQDDIWMDDKVEKVLKCFDESKCTCVLHDNVVLNSDTNEIIYDSFFKWRKSKTGYLNNIWKNSYIGCCMAFDSLLKNKILPIPNDIEMHDQWIGIINDKYGKSVLLDNRLIKYRRHGNNVSQMTHYGFFKMLRNRVILIFRMVVK